MVLGRETKQDLKEMQMILESWITYTRGAQSFFAAQVPLQDSKYTRHPLMCIPWNNCM